MGYSYNILTSKKDKKSTICLGASMLIFNVINLFLSTFLIAHIYSLTDNLYSYALNVGIFQLSTYLCMFIAYYLFSVWVDKSNRIVVYRVANIILSVFVLVTIFYGKDLAKLIILAGILNGIAQAGYYASYNVLKHEMVSRNSVNKYVVTLNIFDKSIKIVSPILLGALIDISTFSLVAVYVLIISVIQIVLTFFIKAKRPEDSNFDVKGFLKRLKDNPQLKKKLVTIYKTAFVYACVTALSVLLNISIMNNFGSNFSLGAITSAFAVVSIITLVLTSKFTKFGKRLFLYILITVIMMVGAVLFSIIPNTATLIIYYFGYAVCDIITSVNYDVVRNKNLKEVGLYQDIAEHQFIVECIFQIVRISAFGVLILVSLLKVYIVFQIYFVLLVLVYLSMPLMLHKIEKRERENDEISNE